MARRHRLVGKTEVKAAYEFVQVTVRVGHDAEAVIALGGTAVRITEQEAWEIGELLLQWAKQVGGVA